MKVKVVLTKGFKNTKFTRTLNIDNRVHPKTAQTSLKDLTLTTTNIKTNNHCFLINGSTIIAYRASSSGMGGGGMALLDSPTYQNGQKYLAPTFSAGSKYCIKNSSGTTVLIYQHPSSITGSGFMTNSGIRPPGGGGSSASYVFTSPNVTSGTYTMYTNPTISGTANWHGIYVGASATTSGSGTSLTAQ